MYLFIIREAANYGIFSSWKISDLYFKKFRRFLPLKWIRITTLPHFTKLSSQDDILKNLVRIPVFLITRFSIFCSGIFSSLFNFLLLVLYSGIPPPIPRVVIQKLKFFFTLLQPSAKWLQFTKFLLSKWKNVSCRRFSHHSDVLNRRPHGDIAMLYRW